MSHDFLNKSTNNHNVINEDVREATELKFVNDRLISSENDTQAIVKEKATAIGVRMTYLVIPLPTARFVLYITRTPQL